MPSFLHTADLHLDTVFSAHFTAQQAKIRRGEMLRCFSDIIDKAKDVDLLLIAGDMFDTPQASVETISFLKRKFAEISDTRIFICCGNHDPYTNNSVFAAEEFPDNVYVFKDKWECVEIPEIKTRIYGISFSDTTAHLTADFSSIEKEEGITDVILMHGDLVSSGADSIYNPIDRAFIESCNAEYLALGHIHKRSELLRCGRTYYAYPGIPEGRGFDECGDMGYYIGKIEEGIVDVRYERACIRRFFRLEIDISGASDSYAALDIIKKAVLNNGNENDMYRLYIFGRVSADKISFDVIEKEIKDMLYYVEVINNTKDDYDMESLSQQSSLCGEFVRHMKMSISSLEGEDKEIMEDALSLGVEVLNGGGSL